MPFTGLPHAKRIKAGMQIDRHQAGFRGIRLYERRADEFVSKLAARTPAPPADQVWPERILMVAERT